MNKADLIDSISSSSGLPKSKVDEVLGTTIDCIIKAVSKGENVQLVGFGTFGSGKGLRGWVEILEQERKSKFLPLRLLNLQPEKHSRTL